MSVPIQLAFSPEGEPLCLPPPPEELCPAARRRLGEVEADLRRRLSGPDRPMEAVQLERFAAGIRDGLSFDWPRSEDPLLEQGVLALCAAQLLGMRPLVHLGEGLSLRGHRVRRSRQGPDQPPRALEVIDQIHRGEQRSRDGATLEVCQALRSSPAMRTLTALSAAGLSAPLVIMDMDTARAEGRPPFCHAGLQPPLLHLVLRAAAPHPVEDAAAPMAPLREALSGRNPWHLYHLAEVPWRDAWAGTQVLREPQLSSVGLELARQALGRPASTEESFALACYALGAAERLASLPVPATVAGPVDESTLGEWEGLLRAALQRLGRRPLLPGPGGEAALLIKQAGQSGLFVVAAHHPEELGRALLPLPGEGWRCAQLRLLSFPRERPCPLMGSERVEEGGRRTVFLDGGDLRAQVTW